MTEQILSLLNPVRILKVQEDWMKIAMVIYNSAEPPRDYPKDILFNLLCNFEHLASKPLTKEMFVCGVENTDVIGHFNYDFENQSESYTENEQFKAHQAALKSVWFAGFEEHRENSVRMGDKYHFIHFLGGGTVSFELCEHDDNVFVVDNCTLYDLIYHITKYNETSDTKIDLRFTESFAEELIK